MAKFIYRMENILNLQMKMENEAKIQLALANNRLREEEKKLEKIYMEISAYENEIRGLAEKKLDVLELKRLNDAIAVKKMEEKDQKKNIAMAQRNVDVAMKKLNEAMIDRKTQENLKEKAFDEFKREVEAEEAKEVDQIISYQYNGNSKEGD